MKWVKELVGFACLTVSRRQYILVHVSLIPRHSVSETSPSTEGLGMRLSTCVLEEALVCTFSLSFEFLVSSQQSLCLHGYETVGGAGHSKIQPHS